MIKNKKLKDLYEVEATHGAFYTGGGVEWPSDGELLLCQCDNVVKVLNIEDGCIISVLGETEEEDVEDSITALTLSDDNESLVTCHRSSLFRKWKWKEKAVTKVWKSVHKGPVVSLTLSKSGDVLASGGTDSGVRLWNLLHHTCVLSLRGAEGVVSLVKFHPDETQSQIYAVSDDAKIRGWCTQTGLLKVTLNGHFSKITDMVFHRSKNYLVSCGRDKVLILWDLDSGCSVRTIPAYEALEGLVLLPQKFTLPDLSIEDGIHVATAGEKGKIRVWNMANGFEVYDQKNSLASTAAEDGGLSIVKLLYSVTRNSLAVITVDHNIILHKLDTFHCEKQLAGFSDEILDIVFVGEEDSHFAVATNSADIKLYNRRNMGCQLLKGHTDLVLGLATCPTNKAILLSCSKDNSIRLWMMDAEQQYMRCAGSATRHTASVGSLAFSQLSQNFFLSASQDCCLKLWSMPKKLEYGKDHVLTTTHTELAHQKDINCVCISPNDKLVATGSQDKTAKLWSSSDLSLVGIFRGHRRGIWSVRFSPIDQVLVSSSADCSIKLWAISDLSCIKTFEGHESSVLCVEFLNHGMQLISGGADGLLKLWSIKSSECITTMDHHSGRIWALAVSSNESQLVTGGSDSILVVWRDVTEEKQAAAEAARLKLVLQEQQLDNLIQSNHLLAALRLALSLNHPRQVLTILQDVLKRGHSGLEETVKQLHTDQKEMLLNCVLAWNSNSKHCHIAQLVVTILLNDIMSGKLKVPNLVSVLESLLPYTDRHFRRVTQLLQDLHLLQYSIAIMEPHTQ